MIYENKLFLQLTRVERTCMNGGGKCSNIPLQVETQPLSQYYHERMQENIQRDTKCHFSNVFQPLDPKLIFYKLLIPLWNNTIQLVEYLC